jgi:hypothetical protein
MIAGAVLMYISIFFYLLPTDSKNVVKARCVVRKLVDNIGSKNIIIMLDYNSRLNTGCSLLDTRWLLVLSL